MLNSHTFVVKNGSCKSSEVWNGSAEHRKKHRRARESRRRSGLRHYRKRANHE